MTSETETPAQPSGSASGDERWFLVDEQEFLQRSIEDADRELSAGDLTEADHAVLTQRDRQRLAEVTAALAELGPAPDEPPRTSSTIWMTSPKRDSVGVTGDGLALSPPVS